MKFTSDGEIDVYSVGDNTVKLIGYVDDIISLKYVGPKEKALYKITVNNGSHRRVRVVFWENFAKEWHSKITDNVTIEITRGRPSTMNTTYVNLADKLAPLELIVMDCTKIKLGPTNAGNDSSPVAINEITIDDFEKATETQFYITAYVKVLFENINTGGSSYGCGAIANETTKIVVKIAVFNQDENIQIGSTVKILGSKKEDKNGQLFIQVNNSEDIQVIREDPVEEEKIQGYVTPKRSCRLPLETINESKRQKKL